MVHRIHAAWTCTLAVLAFVVSASPVAAGAPTAGVPLGQRWSSLYDGPSHGSDRATSMAVSPDGSTVFVAGDTGADSATIAYAIPDGTQLWAARHPRQGNSSVSLAVSPDGASVYVTGSTPSGNGTADYSTVAYSASTGSQRWVAQYDGPAHRDDIPSSISVSSDGLTVVVSGRSVGYVNTTGWCSFGSGCDVWDYATVAYDAGTGGERWLARYGPTAGSDLGSPSIVSNPDGSSVLFTGTSEGTLTTIAYGIQSGAPLWMARSDARPNPQAGSITTSHDGRQVFVTGRLDGHCTTFAYASISGDQLWMSQEPTTSCPSTHIAASPDDSTIFVAGTGWDHSGEYVTSAYNASDGTSQWRSRYNGPRDDHDYLASLATSPDGFTVFVTGGGRRYGGGSGPVSDIVTVAYSARTGAQIAIARYNGPADAFDEAASVATSPDGTAVLVAGYSNANGTHDFLTLAYDAPVIGQPTELAQQPALVFGPNPFVTNRRDQVLVSIGAPLCPNWNDWYDATIDACRTNYPVNFQKFIVDPDYLGAGVHFAEYGPPMCLEGTYRPFHTTTCQDYGVAGDPTLDSPGPQPPPSPRAVQHHGPHPDPPYSPSTPVQNRESERYRRTSMVPVGPPACPAADQWLDARNDGCTSGYPGDLQQRVLDYQFQGRGYYLARIGPPFCAPGEYQMIGSSTCQPYSLERSSGTSAAVPPHR